MAGVSTAAAIMIGLGAAGAGVAASKIMAPKQNVTKPLELPQPPSTVDAVAKAEAVGAKKRAMATQSIFTNPLGVAGQADVTKKTLLGQ